MAAGGEHPQQVAEGHVDVRLVDGAPEAYQVSQLADHVTNVSAKAIDGSGVLPSTAASDPQGIGEVVKGDHRLDPPVAHGQEDLAVAGDGLGVEPPFLRLDPAPLHRHAMGVLPHLGGQIQIRFRAAGRPPAAGLPRAIAPPDAAGLPLPGPPLVVAVVPFDLVGGGGGAPQEPGGEAQRLRAHLGPPSLCPAGGGGAPSAGSLTSSAAGGQVKCCRLTPASARNAREFSSG